MRIVLALLAAALAGCNSSSCPQNECAATAVVSVTSVTDAAMLNGAMLTVCLGDRCASGSLPTPQSVPGTSISSPLTGDIDVEAFVLTTQQGIAVSASVFATSVKNGDVYTASLVANGAMLASQRLTATYETTHPNGADCDPTCRIATLRQALTGT